MYVKNLERFFGIKTVKRSNKIEISSPFAFQHVAQAVPDDRVSVHSSESSINHETNPKTTESNSSRSSIGAEPINEKHFKAPARATSQRYPKIYLIFLEKMEIFEFFFKFAVFFQTQVKC